MELVAEPRSCAHCSLPAEVVLRTRSNVMLAPIDSYRCYLCIPCVEKALKQITALPGLDSEQVTKLTLVIPFEMLEDPSLVNLARFPIPDRLEKGDKW